jgi:hypothetical protein
MKQISSEELGVAATEARTGLHSAARAAGVLTVAPSLGLAVAEIAALVPSLRASRRVISRLIGFLDARMCAGYENNIISDRLDFEDDARMPLHGRRVREDIGEGHQQPWNRAQGHRHRHQGFLGGRAQAATNEVRNITIVPCENFEVTGRRD